MNAPATTTVEPKNKGQAKDNWTNFLESAKSIHSMFCDEEKVKATLKDNGVKSFNKSREEQCVNILKDYAATFQWTSFLEAAKNLCILFDQNFVQSFIENRGGDGHFDPAMVGIYLAQLKVQSSKLNEFIEEAVAINPRFYGSKLMIRVALEHRYGMPNPEDKNGMLAACRMFERDWTKRYGWAMACPICGAPTRRNPKWDGFFKHYPDLFFGWECTADPHEEGKPSHFMQYVGQVTIKPHTVAKQSQSQYSMEVVNLC
jgi:hypothetical protein